MNEWIHEVEEKEGSRLTLRSLAKDDRELVVAHRRRSSSKGKIIHLEREGADVGEIAL